MEEEFDINAFVDGHDDEDLESLTIFIPDELKVDTEDEEDDFGKYDHDELHKSTLDLIAAVHPVSHKICRDTAIAIYPTVNLELEGSGLTYIGSWFDYFTDIKTGNKHCNEVNLYLEITDLSEWPMTQVEVVQFDSLKTSKYANNRKIYSSLINRVL
jgi:hypothetical protein